MAESDDEHADRKKRDKFRRERSDYSTERRRNDHDRRSTWREEYNDARKRSRDDDDDRGGGRYHHSPVGRRGDWSPPSSKRYRRDGWESLRDYGPGMVPGAFAMMDRRPPPWMMGGDGPPGMPHGSRGMPRDMMMGFTAMGDSRQRGSTLLTFKQFLTQQDDNIDDEEAIKLYHEYKADFKKKQLHQFFNDHKEEDWLLAKYNPKRFAENERDYLSNVKTRAETFEWFHEHSKLDTVPFVATGNEDMVRMMDMAVILIEGGKENDFEALDTEPQELLPAATETSEIKVPTKKKIDTNPKSEGSTPPFDASELTPEQQLLANQAKQYRMDIQPGDSDDIVAERKRQRDDSPNSEEKTESKKVHEDVDTVTEEGTSVSDGNPPLSEDPPVDGDPPLSEDPPVDGDPPLDGDNPLVGDSDPPVDDVGQSLSENSSPLPNTEVPMSESDSQPLIPATESPPIIVNPEPKVEPSEDVTEKETEPPTETSSKNEDIKMEDQVPKEEDNSSCSPRHLHITKAVYIRHIPPQLSAVDILEVCQTIPGYLRLAFAEPQPDKGYERRGWVTYSAETNIIDVTARISAAKIKGIQLSCQVNRDLSRRVKPVPVATWARGVVIHDIKQLLKIIEVFDKKGNLWQYRIKEKKMGEGGEEESMETGRHEEETIKINPLLNIPESLFVVESSSSKSKEPAKPIGDDGKENGDVSDETGDIGDDDEEEEGVISDPSTVVLSLKSPLIQVLDRLLWYVRLVHSLDYYNFTHFPDEDRMPHRCGIVSARPVPPVSISSEEVADYIKHVDEKITPLLIEKKVLNNEQMEKLGKRDQDTELEKFIDANTQKLGENKYLCPLSGKKFRGPDFVRKHIFNKHKEALEEVKIDTEYFNNYLKDPDRPVPLDGSALIASGIEGSGDTSQGRGDGQSQRSWGSGHDMMMPGYHGSRFDHRGGGVRGQRRMQRPRGSGFGGGNRGGVSGRRKLHHYEDLDAPSDMY